MDAGRLNRRGFVKGALGAMMVAGMGEGSSSTVSTAAEPAVPPAGRQRPIRLGAPVFEKIEDPSIIHDF